MYSILLYGLKNGKPGYGEYCRVYSHEDIHRGLLYRVYTHMPDGVCYTVCCELDIDDKVPNTNRPGNQQIATEEEYVRVTALSVSALTMKELHKLIDAN